MDEPAILATKTPRVPYATPKQLETLRFIKSFQDKHGVSPTLEEIAKSKGVTKITIYECVNQLERKGWLSREKFRARSIQLLYNVPTKNVEHSYLSGSIENAKVNHSTPDSDDSINMLQGSNIYLVGDESLKDKGILRGEYIIAQYKEPKAGDLVLVQMNEELKIKSYKPEYKTNIRGVVVGAIRSLE